MAIITKPTVIKGQNATFQLDKSELAEIQSVMDDDYFSDMTNWNKVLVAYDSDMGNQVETISFDAAETWPEANFLLSDYARDQFIIKFITITDFDGGSILIQREELNVVDFDLVAVDANNFLLTENNVRLKTESGDELAV